MASTTVKEAPAAQGADNNSKLAIAPIPVIESSLSKTVSLVRPAVLFGLLTMRFNALVAEPVSTLQSALPVVALIQVAYVIICLPVAGSQTGKAAKKTRPGEKKKADGGSPNAISTAFLALLLTAMSTPVICILFMLFGAPVLDHNAHTLLCAAHFTLLGLFPVFYSRGLDGQAFVAIAGAAAPLDETFGGLVGAVVGAWLGAIPIPLDWDREWQKWPVTILAAMYGGSLLFSLVSGGLLYGKRFGDGSHKTSS